jgi:hypothetical protein
MRGRSRLKDGVASLAYARASMRLRRPMDCRVKPGNDKSNDLCHFRLRLISTSGPLRIV